MRKTGSGPAFPTVNYEKPGELYGQSIMTITGGLTKREYFAALAMQGLLSSETHYPDRQANAKRAVEFADALLTELEKEKSDG